MTSFRYLEREHRDVVVCVCNVSVVYDFYMFREDSVFNDAVIECRETVVVDSPEFRAERRSLRRRAAWFGDEFLAFFVVGDVSFSVQVGFDEFGQVSLDMFLAGVV